MGPFRRSGSHGHCRVYSTWNQITFLVLLACLQGTSTALELDPDGGYHVQISIQSESLESSRAQEYIDRLQADVYNLAKLIYDTSSHRFNMKSVSVLIPSDWSLSSGQINISSSQSHYASDIKISDDTLIPDVIRPTQCHFPGDEIRLPVSVLREDGSDDLFKSKDKALLHLWAQYRWGVFDESGFPGSSRFPYFHKDIEELRWEINACSNVKMTGSNIDPGTGETCVVKVEDTAPDKDCRFIPDEAGNDAVKTSLMNSFYRIPTIDTFCSKDTHDITLVNRQNTFCEYQSITDVMTNSMDWNAVTNLSEKFIEPSFSVVKSSPQPLVYYLIDSRLAPIPYASVKVIQQELVKLFDVPLESQVEMLCGFGIFPGSNGQSFEELISWTLLKDHADDFSKHMSDTIAKGEIGDGEFGVALKDIVESIKNRKHSPGAFIFILRSSPVSDFLRMPYEEELIALMKATKVKLFAVEVKASGTDNAKNLFNLVTEVGGDHLILSTPKTIVENLPQFINEFKKTLLYQNFEDAGSSTTIYKEIILPDSPTKVPIMGAKTAVEIRLTSSDLNKVQITVNDGRNLPILQTRFEYNEKTGKGRKLTALSKYDSPHEGDVISISYSCKVSVDCRAMLIITSDDPQAVSDVDISVSTSAGGDAFSLEKQPQGLGIYAKLELNGQPLISLKNLEASATLCKQDDPSQCWTTALTDNGAGFPDLIKNDGILSGIFVPSEIGKYNCWTTVSIASSDRTDPLHSDNSNAKSVDQNLYPCSCYLVEDEGNCVGAPVPSSVQMVADYPIALEVVNVDVNREVVPTRISDLKVSVAGSEVAMTWTSPGVYLVDGQNPVETFDFRSCDSIAVAIEEFDSCVLVPVEAVVPAQPGQEQYVIFDLEEYDKLYFIAARTVYQGKNSAVSNVVRVKSLSTTPPTDEPPTSGPPTSGPPTEEPPTTGPPTEEPPISEPPTSEFPTDEPPTSDPPTDEPPTSEPPTDEPPTSEPSTDEPHTSEPPTDEPPTSEPPTDEPHTGEPPTDEPPSSEPPTDEPPSSEPPTDQPPTSETPTTAFPSPSSETTEPSTSDTTTVQGEPSSTITDPAVPTTIPPTSTSTVEPNSTEEPVYFFKRPEGYATAAAIGVATLGGIGSAVGYLFYKRHVLINAGKVASGSKRP